MKKILIGLLFGLCASAQAVTYQSVRASTANIITPTLQTGAMNLSSGTIQNFRASTFTVVSSATIPNLSVSTLTVTSSATISNLSVSTLAVTSTGTIVNFGATTAVISSAAPTSITFSGDGRTQTSFHYFQFVSSSASTATSTTSSTFLPAGATAQITIPANGSTHSVKVCVGGTLRSSNSTSTTVFATILRNNIDATITNGSNAGIWGLSTSTSVDTYMPMGGCFTDASPGAGTWKYNVGIRTNGGGGTVAYNPLGGACSVTAEEIF